jgi:hypothetical protein
VVNDHQLERGELAGYRLLVVPDRNELTVVQRQAVETFAARGGAVIENDRGWNWRNPEGRETAFAGLRALLRPHVIGAPLRVSGGLEPAVY